MSKRHRHTQAEAAPVDAAAIRKGARFGRWRLLRDSSVLRGGHRYAACECVCGHQAIVYEVHLRGGRSTGCKRGPCLDAWIAKGKP